MGDGTGAGIPDPDISCDSIKIEDVFRYKYKYKATGSRFVSHSCRLLRFPVGVAGRGVSLFRRNVKRKPEYDARAPRHV